MPEIVMQPKRYLSHGGGLNSWALYLWLMDQGIEFEAVFADHGADWPETYQYMQDRIADGYPVTILETRRNGLNLYDYYWKYQMIPARIMRACTQHYKAKPLQKYHQAPCTVYLGIAAEESHRAKPSGKEDMVHEYPLVDEGIDRKGCQQIILDHGLPLPMKSGCFVCPFQRAGQWRELRTKHPELFCRAKALEDRASARLVARGGTPMYLSNQDKPLDVVAEANQLDLFGERTITPCLCEL